MSRGVTRRQPISLTENLYVAKQQSSKAKKKKKQKDG